MACHWPLGAWAVGGGCPGPGGSWLFYQGKLTGYYRAFVCLVTQLLVIEKFHRSAQGRPSDPLLPGRAYLSKDTGLEQQALP